MNLLLDKLPDRLLIDDKEYSIKTNFRQWIKFELVMSSQSSNDEKFALIQSFFDILPLDIDEVIDKMIWFYQCGDAKHSKKGSVSSKKIYDYEYDQFIIYTAFIQYYKVDLNAVEYMHWWTFRQMFLELPDESKIKKVMMYRGITLNSHMSKEQRQFYAEMKRLYALPDGRTEKQKANSIGSILAGGMKIKK